MHSTILSTADIARLFHVTETTVKRWADEGRLKCQKTPGGHRKFSIRQVVAFAEENNFEPCGILELSDDLAPKIQMAVVSRDFAQMVDAFVLKSLSPNKTDLFDYLSYLYEHRIQLGEIFDLVLRPAMGIIGERWAAGTLDISHEHRASHETLDALAKLQAQINIKPQNGFVALLACLGEEMHEIGLRCAAYLLESEGWDTHYLGARTPPSSIVTAIRELRPDLVCLSVTSADAIRPPHDSLHEIAETIHASGGRVFGGGAGVQKGMLPAGVFDAVLASTQDLLGHHLLPQPGAARPPAAP